LRLYRVGKRQLKRLFDCMAQKEFAIKTAKAFVKDCNDAGLFFDKVFLFGSYARENANDWSDVDLLLVSKRFTNNIFDNLRLYLKINARYPIIETHPYPADYFELGDAFIEDILKTSIEIV
jgi:predicted nucleotidyltransferase